VGAVRVSRTLLLAALVAFALPFLTVTCYGQPVTVSGVQAATTIDLDRSTSEAEAEVIDEEPVNAFAIVALVATFVGLVGSFRRRSRDLGAWPAVVGVIALQGFLFYALVRSNGNALPGVGLAAATASLGAAAWATASAVPRWIAVVGSSLAAAMVVGGVMLADPVDGRWPVGLQAAFLTFLAGTVLAIAIAVGALLPTAHRDRDRRPRARAARSLMAGVVGLVTLAAGGVVAVWMMTQGMDTGEYAPPVDSSLAVALGMVFVLVVASLVAWGAGRVIVHGRRPERPAVEAAMSHA
jgi:hypothetical protein